MTSPGSSSWQKFSATKLLAGVSALLVFSSCSSLETDGSSDLLQPRQEKAARSGEFEWAVQHYEAGDYTKAIRKFELLRSRGSETPGFDLLPFYLGMSHFRLAHPSNAATELESFLRGAGERQEVQDARMALLLTYEKQERWKDLAALAAETDKKTLFQNNRALLKLLWARALREQEEIKGAKAALNEALPYLDKLENDERAIPFFSEPDQDLWGRYHFTMIALRNLECSGLGPRDLTQQTPKSKAKPNRLYTPWLEGITECLRKGVKQAAEELYSRESPWSSLVEQNLQQSVAILEEKLKGFLREEAPRLNQYRALQKNAQQQLYRLLEIIDENLKNFKNRDLNSTHLLNLRKQVDRLIMAISAPS